MYKSYVVDVRMYGVGTYRVGALQNIVTQYDVPGAPGVTLRWVWVTAPIPWPGGFSCLGCLSYQVHVAYGYTSHRGMPICRYTSSHSRSSRKYPRTQYRDPACRAECTLNGKDPAKRRQSRVAITQASGHRPSYPRIHGVVLCRCLCPAHFMRP